MKPKRIKVGDYSELRQDLVSGDWIVIATGRARRPDEFAMSKAKKVVFSKKECPFEDPHKTGHEVLLSLNLRKSEDEWFVMAVKNKFPAFIPASVCPAVHKVGPHQLTRGVGFHEVIITKPHNRTIAEFTNEEAFLVLEAYQRRYWALKDDPCVKYISIFHNSGHEAGATVPHPHSQIIAIPVVPPDINRSLEGSRRFWRGKKRCIHCQMLNWHRVQRQGVVYENKYAIAICPFASRTAFEVRIFPKVHEARFELVSPKHLEYLADALRKSVAKINKGLKNPPYNFFIHTAPTQEPKHWKHYHWHMEILPKTAVWAGFEIGTGIDISTIKPETAASYLAKF